MTIIVKYCRRGLLVSNLIRICAKQIENRIRMNKIRYIISATILLFPFALMAQKITLGSCTTKDGGEFQGEMVQGKPHGKGKTVYNGVLHWA